MLIKTTKIRIKTTKIRIKTTKILDIVVLNMVE